MNTDCIVGKSVISVLKFLNLVMHCGYEKNILILKRGEESGSLKLIPKWFRKKKRRIEGDKLLRAYGCLL